MLLAGKVPEHGVLCLYEEEFVCRASLKIIVFRTLCRNFNFSFLFSSEKARCPFGSQLIGSPCSYDAR